MAKDKINGVLLLNKPLGFSSNRALQKAKHLFNAEKAGHTGTLDPLADGLLPICFGEATKFASYILKGDKEYIATLKLGQATTTYDAEGDVTATSTVNSSLSEIQQCLLNFVGEITQVPPIYSALKVNGRRLYEYARSGEEVIIQSRQITIYDLEMLEFIIPDIVKIRVACSTGTYIRTLAHDIGISLGCGAHLIGLTRTKSNQFILDKDLTLERVISLTQSERQQLLLPPDIMLQHLRRIDINDNQFAYIRYGHAFNADAPSDAVESVRLYYKNQFLGVAHAASSIITPSRLINTVPFQ